MYSLEATRLFRRNWWIPITMWSQINGKPFMSEHYVKRTEHRNWSLHEDVIKWKQFVKRTEHRNWSLHEDVIKWKHFLRYWPFVRPVTRSFDIFFHLCPNKRMSKQSWGWWFETLSHSLWRHGNELIWSSTNWLLGYGHVILNLQF